MAHDGSNPAIEDYLDRAAHHARAYRAGRQPIGPTASVSSLRERFCLPLSDHGRSGAEVIDALIGAAEVGLVGNTDPNFFAWVMGGSNLVGVAADWLTSAWGQNAAIFQSSPAAAVAEEAVESWLLELLDLPRESSVGFVGGATTAAFVCLAAARAEVLRRAGYDLDRHGLQGAPLVAVFLSEDAHVTNFAALRNLGFGDENFHRMPSDGAGLMRLDDLAEALAHFDGPKIIIAQAGHINSGAFEPLQDIAGLARRHDAWLHIDGAFGLWARASLGAGCRRRKRRQLVGGRAQVVADPLWLGICHCSRQGCPPTRHAEDRRIFECGRRRWPLPVRLYAGSLAPRSRVCGLGRSAQPRARRCGGARRPAL